MLRCICLLLIALGLHKAKCFSGKVALIRRRYRARVAYDGSNFQGFQLQGGTSRRTVQGELEKVLSLRLNQPIRVVAAGRTDSGVHARGQAIHFDAVITTGDSIECNDVEVSLRRMLPPDLVLWNLEPAPERVEKQIGMTVQSFPWNVMYDSTHKLYSYRLCVAPVMDPWKRHTRWHPDRVHEWIDLEYLEHLLQYYVGTHDFRAFAGSIEQLEKQSSAAEEINTVRTVYGCDVIRENNDGDVRIDIFIKGALYKQIRNMIGTALDVCQGKLSEESFSSLLSSSTGTSRRSDNKSKPAPPEGLTLERVYFGDSFF